MLKFICYSLLISSCCVSSFISSVYIQFFSSVFISFFSVFTYQSSPDSDLVLVSICISSHSLLSVFSQLSPHYSLTFTHHFSLLFSSVYCFILSCLFGLFIFFNSSSSVSKACKETFLFLQPFCYLNLFFNLLFVFSHTFCPLHYCCFSKVGMKFVS